MKTEEETINHKQLRALTVPSNPLLVFDAETSQQDIGGPHRLSSLSPRGHFRLIPFLQLPQACAGDDDQPIYLFLPTFSTTKPLANTVEICREPRIQPEKLQKCSVTRDSEAVAAAI